MVSKHMFTRIRDLIGQGKSDRAIARELGINRKTVAKYRTANAPPTYKSREKATRVNPVNGFEERIASLLQTAPDLMAPEIFCILQEEGYEGSLRAVQRHLSKIKDTRPKERFFEQSYDPGEQAQFDFKESVKLPFKGEEKIVHLLIGTLPHSGFFYIKAFSMKTFEAFMDGVHSFFEVAGGMTEKIRFDNLTPCVRRVLKGGERIYTPAFQKAIDYYGLKPLPCTPGKGSDKGDVEREIRTRARRLRNYMKVSGKTFSDFADLNDWLKAYCQREFAAKSQDLFFNEQKALKPLPPRSNEVLCKVAFLMVSAYGTVRLSKSAYSVPDTHIGRSVKVVSGPYDVKIFDVTSPHALVAIHPRLSENENSILLEHALRSLIRKPHAMVRWKHREILFPIPVFRKYYEHLQKLRGYAAEGEFLKTINLVQYVPLGDVGTAIDLWLKESDQTPFITIKSLLLGKEERAQAPIQIPLKPNLSVYDELMKHSPMKKAE